MDRDRTGRLAWRRGATLLLAAAAGAAAAPAVAETRAYAYNARGELVASSVTGGPAGGVQTVVSYDAAGNRLTYVTTGSTTPPRYKFAIPVLTDDYSQIVIPE